MQQTTSRHPIILAALEELHHRTNASVRVLVLDCDPPGFEERGYRYEVVDMIREESIYCCNHPEVISALVRLAIIHASLEAEAEALES